MRKGPLVLSFGAGLTACLVASTAAANAASPGATPLHVAQADGAADDEPAVLDPVEVEAERLEDPRGPVSGYRATRSQTGTRIDAPLEEQPLSIQVLPREIVEDLNATRLEDVVRFGTGAAIGNTLGGTQDNFVIRGFPASIATNGVITGGAVDIQRQTDTANIERVEILRGPGSALFGQGAPGGVVNVITKRPTDRFAVEAESEASSLIRLRQELDVNLPLAETWNLNGRFVGAIEGTDSFRFRDDFDDTFPEDRRFFAPSFSFEPTDRTRVIVSGEYLRSSDVFDRGIPLDEDGSFAADIDDFFGDPDAGTILTEELKGQIEINQELTDNLSLRLFGSTLRYDYEGLSVEPEALIPRGQPTLPGLIPGETILRQLEWRSEQSDIYNIQTDLNTSFTTGPIVQNMLLSFEYQRVDLNTGFEQSGTLRNIDPVSIDAPGTPSPLTPDLFVPELSIKRATDIDAFGLVLFNQISLFERVHMLAGGRVDILSQDTIVEAPERELTALDETEFSPRIGAVIEPFADLPASAFLSYSESFEPNTVLAAEGGLIEPQDGRIIEGGLRYGFNNDRLALTLTLFDIELENVPVATEGQLFTSSTQESRGIEVALQGAVTPNLSVFASYAFTDAELTEVGQGGSELAIGERPQGVPEHSLNLLARYSFDDGPLDGLSVIGALQYASSRINFQTTVQQAVIGGTPVDIQFDAIELDPFVRLDVGLQYDVAENVRFEAGIQNLLNEEIASPGTVNLAIPEPPLTGFGRLRMTF